MENEDKHPTRFDKNKDWRDQINCATTDTELFFPEGSTSRADKDQIIKAKQRCLECLAKVACYEFSKQTVATDGIYGGLTRDERRVRRRQTKKLDDADLSEIINNSIKALTPVYTKST